MEKHKNKIYDFYHYSNGKLLLTGEYLVLHGAKALTLPLQTGQEICVNNINTNPKLIFWQQFQREKLEHPINTNPEKLIFEAEYSIISEKKSMSINLIKSTDISKGELLEDILKECIRMNPQFFLEEEHSYQIKTYIEFDERWGLGTSSTLINNISKWLQIDPFALNNKIFHGSGYDIAAAAEKKPFIYQKCTNQYNSQWKESNNSQKKHSYSTEKVTLRQKITSNILFVYSGNKINTLDSIRQFEIERRFTKSDITQISDLTLEIATSSNITDFQKGIREHNQIMSRILKAPLLSEKFKKYSGELKPLGAWGGDFFIAVSDDMNYSEKYFKEKGYPCFKYHQIVL